MANGNGNGNWASALPVWVRALAIVGVPSGIAVFLVWIGAQDLPRIKADIAALRSDVNFNRKLLEDLRAQNSEILQMERRICAAVYRDDTRSRCFD